MRSFSLISGATVIFVIAAGLALTPIAQAYHFEVVGETQLTTDTGDQFDPSISGSVVVYTDRRGDDPDIYIYDIETATETPILASGDQFFNDISGNLVVYTDFRTGDGEIFLYNIETEVTTNITNHPATQRNPAISGNLVVYEDLRNEILDPDSGEHETQYDIYVLDTATMEETRLTQDPANQMYPTISGSIVAWEDYRNGNADVYMIDLDAEPSVLIPVTTDPSLDREPDVDGDIIAFASNRDSLGAIYYYRISTQETFSVTPGSPYERNPAVSGDYIAYESYEGDADIWIYSICLDIAEPATIDSAEQYLHDLSGNRLVYTDNRNENLDIYLSEFLFDGVPDIEVSPANYNFGEVELASSSSAIISITNEGEPCSILEIEDLSFSSGSSEDFSITSPSAPDLPVNVTCDGSLDIGIDFSPSTEDPSSAVLQIFSNDPDENLIEILLDGVGVADELPPDEQITDILDFIDDSVNTGDLSGSGPGNSAENRLNALINMIEAAGDLIENGDYEEACNQLMDAYKKCDGEPRPPDFVEGDSADDLAQMILNLMNDLGCPQG